MIPLRINQQELSAEKRPAKNRSAKDRPVVSKGSASRKERKIVLQPHFGMLKNQRKFQRFIHRRQADNAGD